MLQLLSPAGSPEAVIAAVQGGADMVYIGYGATEGRRSEKSFSSEELSQSLRYCRVRGCSAAVALEELASDRTISKTVERAVFAAREGASALLVQDLGLIAVLRQVLPDMPLWGSIRMDIHNRDGAIVAAALGLSRIMLATELSLEQLEKITADCPIETAVCVHGPLCFAHAGRCYMSAAENSRESDSCLRCAEPCRGRFSLGGRMDEYPMSMADLYLLDHLEELENAGVTCAVIGGRSRRPEYVYHVTKLYARAIRERVHPTREELEQLQELFAPNGLTDGYLTGETGAGMFGVLKKPDRALERAYGGIRKEYLSGELRRVPVKFYVVIQAGQPARFAAEDDRGHRAVYQGFVPADVGSPDITATRASDIFHRTGGTPYSCTGVQCVIDPHTAYPEEALEEARRALLSQITDQSRRPAEGFQTGQAPEAPEEAGALSSLHFIIQISREEQLSQELARTEPDYLYVPAELLAAGCSGLDLFREMGTEIAAVLPPVVTDSEMPVLRELLAVLAGMGVKQALIGNLGLLPSVLAAGMDVRGDLGLNLSNSWAAACLGQAGFSSVTASCQLSAQQIRRLTKSVDTEMIIYGRTPVMITDHCLIRSSAGRCACSAPANMGDPFGRVFPVEKEFGCRNVVCDAQKIFLADKPDLYKSAGLWGARLLFTAESRRECAEVAKRYRGQNSYRPNNISRGQYSKGAI